MREINSDNACSMSSRNTTNELSKIIIYGEDKPFTVELQWFSLSKPNDQNDKWQHTHSHLYTRQTLNLSISTDKFRKTL